MRAYEILDIKEFTKTLFSGEYFDRFAVEEVRISTFNVFSIHGRLQKEYYADEEEREEYASWGMLRPICYQLIKGKRLPLSFKIIFRLGFDQALRDYVDGAELQSLADTVKTYYLNIRYEEKKIYLVTGCAYAAFSTDKNEERLWDDAAAKMLKEIGATASSIS